jgi:DNA ligase-1
MIEALKTLQKIAECTGKGSQEQMQRILKSNLTPELEFLLEVAYNPFITTKLNKLDMSEPIVFGTSDTFEAVKSLVEKLKNAKAANKDLREQAIWVISSFPHEVQQTLCDVITKNLNIGIQAKSINKAVGRQLIPNPSLMLSEDDVELIDNWDTIYCEHKYDGVRIIALYKDGDFQYFTRNFNQVPTEHMKYVNVDLHSIVAANPKFDFEGWFFDGELTDHDRKSVSGKLNRMLKGKVDGEISKDFMFNIFDIEHQNVLTAGKGITKYLDRRNTLELLWSHLNEDTTPYATEKDAMDAFYFGHAHGSKHICLSERWTFSSVNEMMDRYNEIVKEGGEGVICKTNAVYECKRSRSWIKLKEVNDCDLVVTGWIPGEGRRTGYIGSLCLSDSTSKLRVDVGSGFTDADLKMVNELINNNELIGKIVAIQYNLSITDKHGNHSLFLPRFIEVRNDKSEADNINNMR